MMKILIQMVEVAILSHKGEFNIFREKSNYERFELSTMKLLTLMLLYDLYLEEEK